jgi:hypothetical protein
MRRRKPQPSFRATLIKGALALVGLGLIWIASESGAIERVAALLLSPMAPD